MQLDPGTSTANLILRLAVPARPADVEQMAGILRDSAPQTLPLSAPAIRAQLGRYLVIRMGDVVVAMASLQPLGPGRYELRSVAVASGWKGRGLGSAIVSQVKREVAAREGRMACVTTNPGFFARHGFREIPLSEMPPKPARKEHPVDGTRCAMEWDPTAGRRKEGDDGRSDLRASA